MKVQQKELARLSRALDHFDMIPNNEPQAMNWGCSAECGGLGEYFFSKEVSAVQL